MNINTYQYTRDFVQPGEYYYRLLAGNGLFFRVITPFFDALVLERELDAPNDCAVCEERATLTVQRIRYDRKPWSAAPA